MTIVYARAAVAAVVTLGSLTITACTSAHRIGAHTPESRAAALAFVDREGIRFDVEYTINTRVLHAAFPRGGSLPMLKAYDSRGQLLFEAVGNKRDTVDSLDRALERSTPVGEGDALSSELALVEPLDGRLPQTTDLPTADWIVVVHWASWCDACRALLDQLRERHAQRSGRLVLVGINWD
jgi:thiol-disulfide isomerase/thioredoxin